MSWYSRAAQIATPRARRDIRVQEIDGEAVVVDPRSGAAHRLNPTAYRVWRACDGHATTRQLAESLTLRYDIDFDRALDDVEAVILTLAERDLVEEPVA